LDEDETVVWNDRPHWLWFLLPQLGLLFGLIALLALLSAFGVMSASAASLQLLLLVGLIYWPAAVLFAINYFNDYYVITNRRVTRRDRRLLVWEQRLDAPLEMVQDVTVDAGLLGRLFDFGHVAVRTAAKIGAIQLIGVPQPEDVKNLILQERAGVAAASRGQQKEVLRRGLVDGLGLAQPVPDPDQVRALGANVGLPRAATPGGRLRGLLWPGRRQRLQTLPGARKPKPGWLLRLTGPLPRRLRYVLVGPPVPAPKPNPGQIVWRKHWINLVMRAGTAALSVIVLLLLLVVAFTPPGDILGAYQSGFVLVLLILLIPASLWFLWDYVDYRNDIYVVTDEKIIDIERKPLGLASSRRESQLDRIQNVSSRQDGLLANILNFGTVEIQTAAMDAGFTFFMVGQPKQVQRIIFEKVDVYRRLQEEKALALRQRELIEGLQVYHEMLRERQEGRI
jgi:membrane protein YdbS with pleckstrin-like domain